MTPQAFEDAVLETIRANGFKACYIRPLIYRGYEALGVNPLPCPVDAAIIAVGMGRLPRRRGAREGRRRVRQLLDAQRAQHLPGARQGDGQLRQLGPDQDGGDRRRLRRGDRARHGTGFVSEGSGENLFLVRDGVTLHAAAVRVDPARHHARLGHHAGAGSRLRGARGDDPARDALHRRRAVLRRHGRRDHADPLGRPDAWSAAAAAGP